LTADQLVLQRLAELEARLSLIEHYLEEQTTIEDESECLGEETETDVETDYDYGSRKNPKYPTSSSSSSVLPYGTLEY